MAGEPAVKISWGISNDEALVLRDGKSIPMEPIMETTVFMPAFSSADSPLARKLYVAGHVGGAFARMILKTASKTACDMGIIMGTSHHEPMARNHQEWARKRKQYGYGIIATNQKCSIVFP